MKYRKKPVEIEAVQWTGFNVGEMLDFGQGHIQMDIYDAAWEVYRSSHGAAATVFHVWRG